MRILHISSLYYPDQVGGAEVMAEVLAENQAAYGHAVAVACASRKEEAPAERNGVTVYRTGHGTPYFILDQDRRSRIERAHYRLKTKTNAYAVQKFSDVIRDFRPDVVNTHSLSELPPQIWSMVKRHQTRLVHTLHDYKSICSKGSMFVDGHACNAQHFRCKLLTYPHQCNQSAVDAVTGVGSEILQRHLDANLFQHVPQSLRRVIWNPVDAPNHQRTRAYEPGRDIVFGFLGRIEPSKGIDVLLDACRMLPRSGWQLLVTGRPSDESVPYETRAHGLPVTFTGFMERDAFFDGIDCLIVPSVWPEAFGRTVAEAYIRGVPVIGSATAGIAEQIGPLQPDWLFPPGDAAILAQRMLSVLENPERLLRKPPVTDLVAERVAPAKVTEAYLDLYKAVLNS
ncbi:glycosyltransferase family 4 protein [Bradyrhizobium sp. BR 10289]|uniref:glycosyltransferase family 4 protein n=1 Tax=Bradyrhizobium sp. BR 10289 TaxID=2749993 RepID=UPI001C649EDB|nr:glycosyltransferase family 4 protein [Bradyrhizobium sp. BR 10289]MBW7971563.1 glycosyltransferase family 4 protein [Bradyrhizobium sp. BR 10289]